jgi:hypothetical protein
MTDDEYLDLLADGLFLCCCEECCAKRDQRLLDDIGLHFNSTIDRYELRKERRPQ